MKLSDLFVDIEKEVVGTENIEIKGLSYDSRKISQNYLFFALNGTHTNGANFVQDAISKGAVCVVSQEKIENISCTNIVVKNVIEVMSKVAAKFYDYPDKKLTVIGVTGTNGKTSITYMLESILKSLNIEIAVIGTINYRYANIKIDAPNTTPQSLDLYAMMNDIVKYNIKYLIMEVSSHSLVLGRVLGIEFDIAVWTNLTQDHLDFHKDMESYFQAKKILFDSLVSNVKNKQKFAIINSDDIYGRKIIDSINKEVMLFSYSVIDKNAKFTANNITVTAKGTSFDLSYENEIKHLTVKLIGLHNVYNVLACICICIALGIDLKRITDNISNITPAPGRLELVKSNRVFSVLVDYAHTDDALKNVLLALKNIKSAKIITVFGCGGNRDKTKRPKMAKAACSLSDFVIITSDNPREEDPYEIIKDIEIGAKETGKSNYKIIADRKEAIEYAINVAQKNDIVLLAGKGHENYQIIGRKKFHFDDKEIAQDILSK